MSVVSSSPTDEEINASIRAEVVAKLEEAIRLVKTKSFFSYVEEIHHDRRDTAVGPKFIPRNYVISFHCIDPALPENSIKVTIDTTLGGKKND